MTKQQQFMSKVTEVTEFCMKQTPYCFGCWPVQTIFIYVGFAALTGCLFVKRNHGKVCAVGFAFPETMQRIKAGAKFDWTLPKQADALLIREVIADRETCADFGKVAVRQWPTLKRFFTFRSKPALSLVELSSDVMSRFYGFSLKGGS